MSQCTDAMDLRAYRAIEKTRITVATSTPGRARALVPCPITMPKPPSDPYDLARFVEAQEASYDRALSELRAGRKQSHWSWYILPQLRGLGASPMSVRFGIGSLAEARAYLEHPVLGARLRECVATMSAHQGLSASEVLGEIDAMKFRSCLTLFAEATKTDSVFTRALERHFSGNPDGATLALLSGRQGASDVG